MHTHCIWARFTRIWNCKLLSRFIVLQTNLKHYNFFLHVDCGIDYLFKDSINSFKKSQIWGWSSICHLPEPLQGVLILFFKYKFYVLNVNGLIFNDIDNDIAQKLYRTSQVPHLPPGLYKHAIRRSACVTVQLLNDFKKLP